jgi:hypothetical protein
MNCQSHQQSLSSEIVLWIPFVLSKQIQREGFRVRQRIWSSLISLSRDEILVASPLSQAKIGNRWFGLVNPKDGKYEVMAGGQLWWRCLNRSDLPEAEEKTPQETKHIELALSPHPPSSNSVEWSTLEQVNPLEYWVRSPEQAMIRRALLTQKGQALCVSAPRGSGVTYALTGAICDWLDAEQGECIFVTRSPSKVTALMASLSDQSHRVHLLTPSQLTQRLLKSNKHDQLQSDLLGLESLEEGSILADAMSEEEWSKWTKWAYDHKDILGPWLDWVGALRRLILKRVVVLGAPSANASMLKERLSELPKNWRDGLANLGQTLWESSLLNTLRELEEVTEVNWPWPQARALVIDDCLSLPWQLIYKTLKFSDEHLGVSGRKWTLMLASCGEGGQSAAGVRLDEVETLINGVLGRHIHHLRLNFSERLPPHKTLGLRRLVESWRAERNTTLPMLQLASNVHINQHILPEIKAPLWHIVMGSDQEIETLIALLKTCVATPGAYVLDLSPRPHPDVLSLLQDVSHISDEMRRCVVLSNHLDRYEIQWLFVYRGGVYEERQPLIPEILQAFQNIDFQGLYYLLTRTPTPLVWLGDLPLDVKVEQLELEDALHRVSNTSPWGGVLLFENLERARALLASGINEEALPLWAALREPIKRTLNVAISNEVDEVLEHLYCTQLSVAVETLSWPDIEGHIDHLLNLSFPNEPIDVLTVDHLPDQAILAISTGVSEQIQRGEEALCQKDINTLITTISELSRYTNLCTAPLYYDRIKERCRHWSESVLLLPIPQAKIQLVLIKLLAEASPQSSEYRLLQSAYIQPPSPLSLTHIALDILSLTEPLDSDVHQRREWTMRHLHRWLIYLLEPRGHPAPPQLASSTVAIGFALVAAKHQDWDTSALLANMGDTLINIQGLDPKWTVERQTTSEQQIEDEHRRRQWKTEWKTLCSSRTITEEVHDLRAAGDFESIFNWYGQAQKELPHDLKVIGSLIDHLEELSKYWRHLSDNERISLEKKWMLMQKKSDTPKL